MTAATNPLSYNAYIQQIAAMAVYQTALVGGVQQLIDAPAEVIVPQMLNYSELRIQRDLDLLSSQTSNSYALIAGANIFPLPCDDFFTVQTLEITQADGTLINTLVPVSKEFIQNCYGGLANAGAPLYFAMYGDNFGGTQNQFTNILLGPAPNFAYVIRVTGTARSPSLFKFASAGVADTQFTYISTYVPDMLIMASMIYISAYQRNFSATSDSTDMGVSYEKQYQALRLGAVSEENRRRQQGSAWSSYSTPVSATPTR